MLHVVIGKQEFRFNLTLNYWGIGVDLAETDDRSIQLGPLDIGCEYGKFTMTMASVYGQPTSGRSRRYANHLSASMITPRVGGS